MRRSMVGGSGHGPNPRDTRYTRQIRLTEVGEVGQARLAQASATVATRGIGGEFEARYLAGAGVGRIRCADECPLAAARSTNSTLTLEKIDVTEAVSSLAPTLYDETAQEALEGALRALQVIRSILEENSPKGSLD